MDFLEVKTSKPAVKKTKSKKTVVKKSVKKPTKKQCAPGKVLNPTTGRCINKPNTKKSVKKPAAKKMFSRKSVKSNLGVALINQIQKKML